MFAQNSIHKMSTIACMHLTNTQSIKELNNNYSPSTLLSYCICLPLLNLVTSHEMMMTVV